MSNNIIGYREKILTPEMLQKKAIKSQKRKQQADEKRENDKKRTMERLLKKHESKSKTNSKGRMARKSANNIIYISRDDKVSLIFPEGVHFPLKNCLVKYVYYAIIIFNFILSEHKSYSPIKALRVKIKSYPKPKCF